MPTTGRLPWWARPGSKAARPSGRCSPRAPECGRWRSPDSESAQDPARQGAQPVYADLTDAQSLREAFSGVDGVFAMTTFATERGTEGEVEDGKMIAEAARDADVPHVVYSSVGGAERDTGVPHFESKRRVEERMETLELPVTFVRPAFFMDKYPREIEFVDELPKTASGKIRRVELR